MRRQYPHDDIHTTHDERYSDDEYSSSRISEDTSVRVQFPTRGARDRSGPIDSDFYSEEEHDSDQADPHDMVCPWLMYSPVWIRSLVIASGFLLVFSITFLGVAAIMGSDGRVIKSSSTKPNNAEWSNGSETDSEVPTAGTYTPTGNPSMHPSIDRTFTTSTVTPTGNPSPHPSLFVTEVPATDIYTSTGNPSLQPSRGPVTSTTIPAEEPSLNASTVPTLSASTPPTMHPSNTPIPSITITQTPTAAPTTISSFYVMGDRFDESDESASSVVEDELANLRIEDGEFLVHLGDFNDLDMGCSEESYMNFRNLLKYSKIPVFVTPGDNEWNDCEDPERAMSLWRTYLWNVTDHWSHPRLQVSRQTDSRENFAFMFRNVLYVGLTVVGGRVLNEDDWSRQTQTNLNWVRMQMALYNVDSDSEEVQALVIFGHSARSEKHRNFFQPLAKDVESYRIPTMYIHETNDVTMERERVFNKDNFWFLRVQGGVTPFTRVTVDTSKKTDPFSFDGR